MFGRTAVPDSVLETTSLRTRFSETRQMQPIDSVWPFLSWTVLTCSSLPVRSLIRTSVLVPETKATMRYTDGTNIVYPALKTNKQGKTTTTKKKAYTQARKRIQQGWRKFLFNLWGHSLKADGQWLTWNACTTPGGPLASLAGVQQWWTTNGHHPKRQLPLLWQGLCVSLWFLMSP